MYPVHYWKWGLFSRYKGTGKHVKGLFTWQQTRILIAVCFQWKQGLYMFSSPFMPRKNASFPAVVTHGPLFWWFCEFGGVVVYFPSSLFISPEQMVNTSLTKRLITQAKTLLPSTISERPNTGSGGKFIGRPVVGGWKPCALGSRQANLLR